MYYYISYTNNRPSFLYLTILKDIESYMEQPNQVVLTPLQKMGNVVTLENIKFIKIFSYETIKYPDGMSKTNINTFRNIQLINCVYDEKIIKNSHINDVEI